LHRDVLAAAAADADQHLAICASVGFADGRVDCPGESEVTRSDRSADQKDVTDHDRVETHQCQNATELLSLYFS